MEPALAPAPLFGPGNRGPLLMGYKGEAPRPNRLSPPVEGSQGTPGARNLLAQAPASQRRQSPLAHLLRPLLEKQS